MANHKTGQRKGWSRGYTYREHKRRYPEYSSWIHHAHPPSWMGRQWRRRERMLLNRAMRTCKDWDVLQMPRFQGAWIYEWV